MEINREDIGDDIKFWALNDEGCAVVAEVVHFYDYLRGTGKSGYRVDYKGVTVNSLLTKTEAIKIARDTVKKHIND